MIERYYPRIAQALGPIDAICACDPPHARGGTGSWWMNLVNLLGLVYVRHKAIEIYLALRGEELVHVGIDDGGDVCEVIPMPLEQVSSASTAVRNEYQHAVSFSIGGENRKYNTRVGLWAQETPPQIIPWLKQMEGEVVAAIASRS